MARSSSTGNNGKARMEVSNSPDIALGDPRGVPIKDVAQILGVPMPTLRSWELRYGIPSLSRGPRSAPQVPAGGGQRPAVDAGRNRPRPASRRRRPDRAPAAGRTGTGAGLHPADPGRRRTDGRRGCPGPARRGVGDAGSGRLRRGRAVARHATGRCVVGSRPLRCRAGTDGDRGCSRVDRSAKRVRAGPDPAAADPAGLRTQRPAHHRAGINGPVVALPGLALPGARRQDIDRDDRGRGAGNGGCRRRRGVPSGHRATACGRIDPHCPRVGHRGFLRRKRVHQPAKSAGSAGHVPRRRPSTTPAPC